MVVAFLLVVMERILTRLNQVLYGAEATGIALPEELVTEIGNLRLAVEANISNYSESKRQYKVCRASLKGMQNTAVLLLRRAREFVGANLSEADRRALREQYGLSTVYSFGQVRLLEILSNVIAISESQTDPALKLPADMIASAQTEVQALQEALDGKRHFYGEQISLRETRVTLELQYRSVRDQVYAHLMQIMPEGCRDARLTDFGFRPSVLRRRQEASEEVTIVSETEVEEVLVEDTVPAETEVIS